MYTPGARGGTLPNARKPNPLSQGRRQAAPPPPPPGGSRKDGGYSSVPARDPNSERRAAYDPSKRSRADLGAERGEKDSAKTHGPQGSNPTSSRRKGDNGHSQLPSNKSKRQKGVAAATEAPSRNSVEGRNSFREHSKIRSSESGPGTGVSSMRHSIEREKDSIPSQNLRESASGGPGGASRLDAEKRLHVPKTSAETLADMRAKKRAEDEFSRRFMGRRTLQYAIWAHRMALASAGMCFFMGVFSALFANSTTYGCKIYDNGQYNERTVNARYQYNTFGTCPTTYMNEGGEYEDVCCQADTDSELSVNGGYTALGAFYIIYSVFIVCMEDVDLGFGWGLWFPSDNWFYDHAVSPLGILHIVVGVIGLSNYATSIAGVCLIATGSCYLEAMRRRESGDGGRLAKEKLRAKQAAEKQAKREADGQEDETAELSCSTLFTGVFCIVAWRALKALFSDIGYVASFNPFSFLYRIYSEDKLAVYVWVLLYALANTILFAYTHVAWATVVEDLKVALVDGTLDVNCHTWSCDVNRSAVKYGPFSDAAPFAKACGACLNMNCALLLLPVLKTLLQKLNNLGHSFKDYQDRSDLMNKFLSYSLARYVPIQKNIEFHRMCAYTIALFTFGHVVGHYANLTTAFETTIVYFEKWGWTGTAYLTGAIILVAMFIIYTAAADVIRHTKYEIFFNAHHCFIIFYLVLFLHGPIFWAWGLAPVLLYCYERWTQTRRGDVPFIVTKVEWISPVLALYFKPLFDRDFAFKEGQYVYLNCPAIALNEWHPFTISSAQDDMTNGPRIHIETGEEVQEVPRPTNLHPDMPWNKYCLLSQNWRELQPAEYIDKSDTVYHDHLSCHIKVHGLEDATAHTWTRKFKEHLESLNGTNSDRFPFFYKRIDHRGDVIMGRLRDDNNNPVIRVDGPHSAPSEHYTNFGTVMMVGAGIGLTPVASVINAVVRHRWKKGQDPEILHMYWVVRANEVESFQWLVHLLAELSFEFKKGRESGQIHPKFYCEFNIYVTGAGGDKKSTTDKPLYRAKRRLGNDASRALFSVDQLYSLLLEPTVSSKIQLEQMQSPDAENRLQDVWVWAGRPIWDDIFADIREQRQHAEIGVCFCGSPAIGYDLKRMCSKYSSAKDDVLFTLHKENF